MLLPIQVQLSHSHPSLRQVLCQLLREPSVQHKYWRLQYWEFGLPDDAELSAYAGYQPEAEPSCTHKQRARIVRKVIVPKVEFTEDGEAVMVGEEWFEEQQQQNEDDWVSWPIVSHSYWLYHTRAKRMFCKLV